VNLEEDLEIKVKKLELEEDDILVFEIQGRLTDEAIFHIKDNVKNNLKIKNKIILLEEGMTLSVLKEKEVKR